MKTFILAIAILLTGCNDDLKHTKLSGAISVRTDPDTGCEYILYNAGFGRGIAARTADDGISHKGCGEK